MRKFKSYKILCLTLGVTIAMSGAVLNASSLTKTLKAVYNNIAVSYNGQAKALSSEPFLINGTVYLPLRAIGEIIGANVSWANNTVYITGQSGATVSSAQEIASKNFEIASLTQKLSLANAELLTLKGTGSTAGSNLSTTLINSTLKKIADTYGEDFDIDWTFDLSLVSGRLELTASYDSKYDSSTFNKTTESKRKQFIKEVCFDIASAHKDTEIRGTLEDSRADTEKASFKYTSSGSYTYDETTTYSLNDFEDELLDDYPKIDCFTGFTLSVDSIDLSERSNTLTFTLNTDLTPTTSDYRQKWNDLTSSQRRDLEDFFDEIINDIEDEYTSYDTIVGVIRDSSLGTIASYDDGDLDFKTVSLQ